jgi:hypothetical protein
MTSKPVYIIVLKCNPRILRLNSPTFETTNEVLSFVGDKVLRFGVIDHSDEFSSGRYEGRWTCVGLADIT